MENLSKMSLQEKTENGIAFTWSEQWIVERVKNCGYMFDPIGKVDEIVQEVQLLVIQGMGITSIEKFLSNIGLDKKEQNYFFDEI